MATSGQEGPQERRVMISSVVQNNHHASVPAAMPYELPQEFAERQRIELRCQLRHQLAGAQIDRPELGDRLPRGSVQQYRICLLGRNPHYTAGSMLLEMAFIQAPQVKIFVATEAKKFF